MEHGHMPADERPPPTQSAPFGADAALPTPAMQQSTDAGNAAPDASRSGRLPTSSDHLNGMNATPSLQLPPLSLSFPGNSTTELAPIQPSRELSAGPSGQTLPPLSSVTGTQSHAPLPKPPESSHPAPFTGPTKPWPSLNPFTTYYKPSYLEPAESPPSMTSESGPSRSVSLDDPDVRIAAEALGQMRTESGSSPRNRASTPNSRATSRDYKTASPSPRSNSAKRGEPLLSLITTSYPLLGSTIENAASAYNTGKSYSPHLKTGAEYVENLVKPAVETVGRKTGVEGGMRWFFMRGRKQRPTADMENDERGSGKRLRSDRNIKREEMVHSPSLDSVTDSVDRRMSISTVDTLPAYDDQRSPAYTEAADNQTALGPGSAGAGQQWGQRFVVTTSGLGVAMKQESMKSLKYCLKVVKETNGYLNDVLVKLKSVIEEYDRASQTDGDDHTMTDGDRPAPHTAEDRGRLIQRMTELRDDLFRVIHRTVQTVSKYAGGALPENAKNLVHSQLMSLPGRYQFHYVRETERRRENAGPDAWTRDSAHLALLFAKEALQMMTQVGEVLNRTLVSAEEWCDTLYRKNGQPLPSLGTDQSLPATPVPAIDQDVQMSG
ncbi:transcription factor Opi1-domain-containing protein [Corynascus novoguineensis]|uniref:Transcription factor Opi1-domain-containing protein n=1 Tax=Corynascus novoguineensis TaxID=1126955 RepID=A0AAN7CM40_9PEZI|nr:transcription factor Opi1-domain-containing protein [Corynascus novoguineensis]